MNPLIDYPEFASVLLFQPEQCISALLGSILTMFCMGIGYLITIYVAPSEYTFNRYKKINVKDELVLDILDGYAAGRSCYVLTDPDLPDHPIVHCSKGFCSLTAYDRKGTHFCCNNLSIANTRSRNYREKL